MRTDERHSSQVDNHKRPSSQVDPPKSGANDTCAAVLYCYG